MTSPIFTTILNNRNSGRTLYWTGEGPVWLPANGSVDVPYDVWSKADRKQRESIIADCQQKDVTLLLHVTRIDGSEVVIEFDPSIIMRTKIAGQVMPQKSSYAEEGRIDEQNHTIHVGSPLTSKASDMYGFRSTKVEAPKVKTGPEGLTEETVASPAVHIVGQQKQAEEQEAKPADILDVVEVPENADEKCKQAYEQAISEKRWEDALEVLKERFGEDAVQFSTRSVMQLKTWEAVTSKYGLL